MKRTGLCVIAAMGALGALSGCLQLGGGGASATDERGVVAAALLNRVDFEGGTVRTGDLPATSAPEVRLTPLGDMVIISPGQQSIMAVEVAHGDEDGNPIAATLIKMNEAKGFVEVTAARKTVFREGGTTRVVVDNRLTAGQDVCDDLCDKVFATTASEVAQLKDGTIGQRATRLVVLDCRDDGDPKHCGDGRGNDVELDGEGSGGGGGTGGRFAGGAGGVGGAGGGVGGVGGVVGTGGAVGMACAVDGMCANALPGVYAVRLDVDAYWRHTDMVDGGRGSISQYYLLELAAMCPYDSDSSGTLHSCGLQLPVVVSDLTCDAHALTFPDSLWRSAGLPRVATTASFTGANPGDLLQVEGATGLLGISLTASEGSWPTSRAETVCSAGSGVACFPDVDGDGIPGITATIADDGTTYDPGYACAGGDGSFRRRGMVPSLLDSAVAVGGTGSGARVTRMHVGLRTHVGAGGMLDGACASGSGTAGNSRYLNSRTWDCAVRPDMMPGSAASTACTDAEADFIDLNQVQFVPLPAGAAPPALQRAGGTALAVDTSPSAGPRSAFVRLGAVTTPGEFGGFSCDSARGVPLP